MIEHVSAILPSVPPDIAPWVYVTCVGAAAIIVGIAKAGFGGGVGILAVPLIATALPANRALGVLLPILIVADAVSVYHHRQHRSTAHLRWLLTGMIAGLIVGLAALYYFHWLDARAASEQRQGVVLVTVLNLTVGSICLLFVAIQLYRLMGYRFPHIPNGPGGGRATGFVSALVSTLSHAAGPIVTIYLLEQKLPKRLLVGTMLIFFFIVNMAKVPGYVLLDMINITTMVESICFLPLVPVGTMLGLWMHHRIPEKPFALIMYIGTALAAGNMIYQSL